MVITNIILSNKKIPLSLYIIVHTGKKRCDVPSELATIWTPVLFLLQVPALLYPADQHVPGSAPNPDRKTQPVCKHIHMQSLQTLQNTKELLI